MKVDKLGNYIGILSGFAFKSELFTRERQGIAIVRIRDIKPAKSETYYTGTFDKRYMVKDGDLLIGMDGEFNREYWNGGNALLNQRVCKIEVVNRNLCKKYLYYFLLRALKEIEDKSNFVTVKHLSVKQIQDINIILPPIGTQKRIAAILDQADELRRARRKSIDHLNNLSQAIFYDMFGDPTSEKNKEYLEPLSKHASKIGSGATPRGGDAAYKASGIPLIRSMNVRDGYFSMKGLAYIDELQASALNNVIVEKNDVLLNITGASVARVCRVPADIITARVNQHVAIIRPKNTIISAFLENQLLFPSMKEKLLNIAEAGATRQAVTKNQIENLKVMVPSLDSQEEYFKRIEIIDRQKKSLKKQAEHLEKLFNSLQKSAFSGEL